MLKSCLKKVITPKGGQPFDISINLNTGWNFFSLPGHIPNTSGNIKDILSSIEGKYEQVSSYDATAGKWKHYVNDPKFNQFDKLDYGKGYLIYMKEPATLTLSGSTPLTKQTSPLKIGWNLICAPTDSDITPAEALKGVTYDSIAEYNGVDYTYSPATFQKGKKRYYVSESPDRLMSILRLQQKELEEKKSELEGVLPMLMSLYNAEGAKPQVRYLEGIEGTETVRKVFEGLAGDFVTIVPIDDVAKTEAIIHGRDEHLHRVIENGVQGKALIVSADANPAHLPDLGHVESRIVDAKVFPIHAEITVRGNHVFFFSYKSSHLSLVIVSQEIADAVKALFDLAWVGSKNVG